MAPAWNTYIAVDDVDAAAAKVAAAGGAGDGAFDVMRRRTDGVRARPHRRAVALWQARRAHRRARVNEPNTLTWNELTSNDLDAALPFYEAVLGLTARSEPMGDAEYTMLYVGEARAGGATAAADGRGAQPLARLVRGRRRGRRRGAATAAGGGVWADGHADRPRRTLADPQGAVFSVIALRRRRRRPGALSCGAGAAGVTRPTVSARRQLSIVTSVPIGVYGQTLAAAAGGSSTQPRLCGVP